MDLALKRWPRSEIGRLDREESVFSLVAGSGFRSFAPPILTQHRACRFESTDIWVANPWIPGDAVPEDLVAVAPVLAPILADLHAVEAASLPIQSRLDDVLRRLTGQRGYRLVPAAYRTSCHAAISLVEAYESRLQGLPVTLIHGDCNLDNTVGWPDHVALVDFEFARRDLRIFDLVSLLAPKRRRDGSYRLTSAHVLRQFLLEYVRCASSSCPLTEDEIRLFPIAATAYWLIVLADVIARQPRWIPDVCRVVEAAVRLARRAPLERRRG